MIISFVRHASVDEKYLSTYYGHLDIPLSSKGVRQGKELAKNLATINFDKIYCSDLLRAVQTLETFKTNKTVIFTPKLREKSWGKHEGKSFDEIQSSGIRYKNFEQWLKDLDGEPIEEYKNNVLTYFEETLLQCKEDNILVITHAGFIRILIAHIEKISLEKSFSQDLDYASVSSFDTKTMQFIEKNKKISYNNS